MCDEILVLPNNVLTFNAVVAGDVYSDNTTTETVGNVNADGFTFSTTSSAAKQPE